MEHRLKCDRSRELSLIIFSRKKERIASFYLDNVVRSFSKMEIRLSKAVRRFQTLQQSMCPALNCGGDINDNEESALTYQTEESRSPIGDQLKITRRFARDFVLAEFWSNYLVSLVSGSACYAIGLRGPDRRAVCFVSLIAERALRWSSSVHSSIYRRSDLFPSRFLRPSSHSGPSRPSLLRSLHVGGCHFIFKKTTAKRTFVRSFFRSRCNWGVRFSSVYGGAMANVPNCERERERKNKRRK